MNKRFFPIILLVFSLKIYSQDILSLDEAITQALSQNYNILLSVNDKEIAQTANSWYAAGKLPSVTANGVWNNSITNLLQKLSNGTVIERNGNRTSVINLNGQFSYRLYGGKRVFIAKKRLDIQESIAEEALKQDINQVVFDVTNSYININRLIKQKSAIQETISFFEERSKLSRSRFEIGTAGKNDYLQSQIDLNVQRNNEINLTNNIALAKMDLNQLLARDPNTPFEVQDIIVPETLPTQAEVMEAIESINPQITLLRYNQQILEQNALEIKALQKPSLFANGSLNFNYNNSSAGFNLFTQNYGPQAGLSVSVPLFTRALANQQIKINALDYKNQGLQIDALKHSLQSSAAESYQNYNNALQLIELEEQNLNIIREHNNIAMERFRKATITTVELRQAQLNLVEAQNRIINARYILKQSEVRLLYVMGRLIQ
ncbi:MAG: TolC family protein [Saprospiraceae bacterium]|jgi:outer membrane protein TolC|nr:TolC family protein [Saprospiraceae bacterium]MBK6478933.1 TolC family protein [Saprospiraceae bacterium]MBK6815672.1 TolC family protein [Saprospiraceae bacterium]MBK7372656.1 TolC family protein [Saprospiraceae bacterium]MBK7439344.1 TolC family protein [Saprospiraceae bacterium]